MESHIAEIQDDPVYLGEFSDEVPAEDIRGRSFLRSVWGFIQGTLLFLVSGAVVFGITYPVSTFLMASR